MTGCELLSVQGGVRALEDEVEGRGLVRVVALSCSEAEGRCKGEEKAGHGCCS